MEGGRVTRITERPAVAAGPYRPNEPGERAVKYFYGAGAIAFGVKDNGFSVLLLLYYNQVLGLEAGLAGLALMLALFADAVTDPVVGYLSDHTRTRWGRRHPYMYAAALPVALSYGLLWNPPAELSQMQLFAWLLTVAILVRTFITFYEIPSTALVAELTDDYDARTSYMSLRYFFGWYGGLGLMLLAFALLFQPSAEHPVGQLNPEGYRTYGLVAASIMFVAILVSALGTHRAIPRLQQPAERRRTTVAGAIREIGETLNSRSAIVLLTAGVLVAVVTGLSYALGPYFNTFFWELSADQISVLVFSMFLAAAAALGLAPWLSRRFDKRRAAVWTAIAMIVLLPVPYAARLAGLFPETGSPLLLPLLFLFNGLNVTLFITWSILVAAMIADVVEDSQVRTGRRAEGVFFAANTFVVKCVSGIGLFASTGILALAGFPRRAEQGAVAADVLRNLVFLYVGALTVLVLAAIACVLAYRITRGVHEANLRRLSETGAGHSVEAAPAPAPLR